MELIAPDGSGPIANSMRTYELVVFTRHTFSEDQDSDFFKNERRMYGIFTEIGLYLKNACIKP